MSSAEGLSEDDEVFSQSDGERLDYSGSSSDGSSEHSSEEEEAIATDEEEDTRKRHKKTSNKSSRHKDGKKKSRFVETEAAVSEDDEEEEEEDEAGYAHEEDEEEDEEDGFVDNEIEEREKAFSAAFERRLAAHAAKRAEARKKFEEELDPEAVEARLRQLYGRGKPMTGEATEMEAALSTVLQPKSTDPKLWLVKCRPGRERAAVSSLLQALTILGDDLGIFSVIGRDSLKGFIYIEAHKMTDVMNAVQKTNMNHIIFASPINKPIMVPLSEMSDVLSASTGATSTKGTVDASNLQLGTWVRVKRGKYSGDLAQIVEVDQETNGDMTNLIIRVKLVPRLNFRGNRGGGRGADKRDRPTIKPFDPQEAAQFGSVTKARGYWLFNGEAYKDGYLYKDVRVSSLVLGDVSPRPDELERFGSLSISSGAPSSVASAIEGLSIDFVKGEPVIITKGEFQHMTGRIDSQPDKDYALVLFDDTTAFKEPVKVNLRFLSRQVAVGDNVRVMLGENLGKVGMVVSIDGKNATIFSVLDHQQFEVPLNFISLKIDNDWTPVTPHGRSFKEDGNAFELHDLVSIDNDSSEAGVIIRLMNEEQHATILDINGQTKRIPFKNLKKISTKSNNSSLKVDPSVFKPGDRIQFVNESFDQESRPASILNVFRNFAFLHTIDSGEIVVKPVSLLSKPGSITSIQPPYHSRSNSRLPSMRHMLGKSITISGAGPYKGYVGILKDITDTHARIELHTNSKVVTVPRERISLPGKTVENGAPERRSSNWGVESGRTHAWTDSRTPAWGASSGKTPAWGGPSGGKTPAWGGPPGGKTPAWGGPSGGKTPAWGGPSGGKTPAWGTASAKTPAWGNSSRTPAWGSGMASRTPVVSADGKKTPSWQQSQPTSSKPSASIPPWIIPNAEVAIKSSKVQAKISSITPNGMVLLSGQNDPINSSELMPVIPAKKDAVKLLNDDRVSGTVIGLDGPDAVIRVDGTADFRIVPINSLVKIAP